MISPYINRLKKEGYVDLSVCIFYSGSYEKKMKIQGRAMQKISSFFILQAFINIYINRSSKVKRKEENTGKYKTKCQAFSSYQAFLILILTDGQKATSGHPD